MSDLRILFLTEQSDRPEAALMSGIAATKDLSCLILGAPNSAALQALDAQVVQHKPLSITGRFDRRAISCVASTLRDFEPHIVHAFTARTLSAATLAALIARPKDPLHRIGYRGTAGHLSRWNPADWVTYLNPTLSGIMCVSDAVRLSLIKFGFSQKKLFTVHKGHELDWYDPPVSRVANPREALRVFGIPDTAVVIGSNANMRPVKGVDVLLKAASLLPTDGSVHYLLVGEVRDPRIHSLADNPILKPFVHLLGYRSDATALMHACDIFAIPSRSREGLPKALIEAMSGSVAVVGSSVGGIPEVVRHGIDGLLVEPDDARELASSLATLIVNSELRRSLGRSGKQRIAEHFTVGKSIALLASYYRELPTHNRA